MDDIRRRCMQRAVARVPTAKIAQALAAAFQEVSARERVPPELPAYPDFDIIVTEHAPEAPELWGIRFSIAPASGMSDFNKQRTQLKELLSKGLGMMDALLLREMTREHATNTNFLLFMSWTSIGHLTEEFETGDLRHPPQLIRRPVFGPGGPASLGLQWNTTTDCLAVLQIPRIGMVLMLVPRRDRTFSEPYRKGGPLQLKNATASHMHLTSQEDQCGKCRSRNNQRMLRCGKCIKTHYCSSECQEAHWAEHKPHCAEYCRIRDKALAESKRHDLE